MLLLTLEEYVEHTYGPKSRPSMVTMRRRIKRDDFPFDVRKEGRNWYVDIDAPRIKSSIVRQILGQ